MFLDTKNGEDRGVPLHPSAARELMALKWRQGTVFRRPDGQPYAEKESGGGQIKTAFRGACKRAGIEDFSPHDCRHTWATWHYAANRDLIALMKLGGWKSERMVLRYAHINTEQLAPSINAMPSLGERQAFGTDSQPRPFETSLTMPAAAMTYGTTGTSLTWMGSQVRSLHRPPH